MATKAPRRQWTGKKWKRVPAKLYDLTLEELERAYRRSMKGRGITR